MKKSTKLSRILAGFILAFTLGSRISVSLNKYFNLNTKYQLNQTNYDRERDNKDSFSLIGGINFN